MIITYNISLDGVETVSYDKDPNSIIIRRMYKSKQILHSFCRSYTIQLRFGSLNIIYYNNSGYYITR